MPRLRINPWVLPLACILWHLDGAGWFLPYILAAGLHELGHIAALSLLGCKITALEIGPMGAKLIAPPLSPRQEALCAAAGPAVSLSLLFFLRRMPWLAFWGGVQGLYNLLPMLPLDGGRVLLCLLTARRGASRAIAVSDWVSLITGLVLLAGLLALGLSLHLQRLCLMGVAFFLLRLLQRFQLKNHGISDTIEKAKVRNCHDRFITAHSSHGSKARPVHRRRV